MADAPVRNTADLSAYPDLVVIYLGMRVEEPRGVETLQALRPQIQPTVDKRPDRLPRTSSSSSRRIRRTVRLARFAPTRPATGPMFAARARAGADRSEAGTSA